MWAQQSVDGSSSGRVSSFRAEKRSEIVRRIATNFGQIGSYSLAVMKRVMPQAVQTLKRPKPVSQWSRLKVCSQGL